jgi:hypothetical protein
VHSVNNNGEGVNEIVRQLFLDGKLREVVQITESLHNRENSYCRLCRAGAYLKLGEQEKLTQLIPLLREPKGYNQASDLYELSLQVNTFFDTPMQEACFEPLNDLINELAFARDQLGNS